MMTAERMQLNIFRRKILRMVTARRLKSRVLTSFRLFYSVWLLKMDQLTYH